MNCLCIKLTDVTDAISHMKNSHRREDLTFLNPNLGQGKGMFMGVEGRIESVFNIVGKIFIY